MSVRGFDKSAPPSTLKAFSYCLSKSGSRMRTVLSIGSITESRGRGQSGNVLAIKHSSVDLRPWKTKSNHYEGVERFSSSHKTKSSLLNLYIKGFVSYRFAFSFPPIHSIITKAFSVAKALPKLTEVWFKFSSESSPKIRHRSQWTAEKNILSL